MARYTPHHWVLVAHVALVLVFVNPVTSHPVGTSQLAKTGNMEDLEARGGWETFGKEEKTQEIQQSRAEHILPAMPLRSTPKRLSQREPSSDESIVSILMPVVPASDYLSHSHDHPTPDKQDIKSSIVPPRQKHYGELFNNQEKDHNDLLEPDTESYSYSTLRISPTHYISFFSYQISFPFLKYAPKCLPRFPLPGTFTTVVLLLSLVWIAILTIALVELGNYMWKKRRGARVAMESDSLVSGSMSSRREDGKIALAVIPVAGSEGTGGCVDNASLMNDYNSDSGSDSEPEVDDYRVL